MEQFFDKGVFRSGTVVCVALSGGRDSMALFDMLLNAREELGIGVVCAHVEHGIRGEDSLRDQKFVEEYCRARGVTLYVKSVDVLSHTGEYGTVEQTARALRYAFFEELLSDGKCDCIATAHHMSDLTETVLMRAFRGTGVGGLKAIEHTGDRIVRPLLGATREDIDAYVESHGIPYVDDCTNDDTSYTRNFIRHEVVPLIKQRYPSLDGSIYRLAKSAAETDGYILSEAAKLVTDDHGDVVVSIKGAHEVLVKRALLLATNKLGVYQDIEARHLEIATELIRGGNKEVDFPFGLTLAKEGDSLILYRKWKCEGKVNAVEGDNVLGNRKVLITRVNQRGKGLFVSGESLTGAVLRYPETGDVFKRYGGGTKSLGDYFTDIKLPRRKRERAIVLAKGNEIMAVIGIEISDKAKIDSKTQIIYQLTEEETNVPKR